MTTPKIHSALLKILKCPNTYGELIYDEANNELISEKAGLAYPVRNGIPIMLSEFARKITSDA